MALKRQYVVPEEDLLTRNDFEKAFKRVLRLVQQVLDKQDGHFQKVKLNYEKELVKISKDTDALISDFQTRADETLITRIDGVLDKQYKELETSLDTILRNYIDSELLDVEKSVAAKIPPPLKGEPGRPPTENEIRAAIKPFVDELKNLIEEKLKRVKGAHFGTIGSVMGGVTDGHVKLSLSRIVNKETPVGAINGSNTTYTVSNPINEVLGFAINGQVINDDEYTVAGNTITMNSAIPAALSGTSFRIKYV